jgi:hypothetical protein
LPSLARRNQLNVVQGLPVFLYGNALADAVDQIIAQKAKNTPHGRRFQISHTGGVVSQY